MKRLLPLLILAVLFAAAPALAQPAELPADARFDQLVSFSTGINGEDLGVMLTALARAVDLTPIVDAVPAKTIVYDIGEPRPFRQVWTLVLTLNDLDYVLQENDIVVLGTTASLERLRDPKVEPEPRVQRFYTVRGDASQLAGLVQLAVRDATVEGVAGVRVISVVGTEAEHGQVVTTLAEFDAPVEEPEPVVEVDPEPRVQRFYTVRGDASQLAGLVQLAVRDATVEGVAGVRVISVVGTEAEHGQVVTTLAEFDAPVEEPEPVVEVDPEPRVQRFYRVMTEASPIAGLLERAALGIQVDVVPDTNILSIVGTAAQQEAATRVLAEFDTIPERIAIEQRTVFLSHAIATELAGTLQETGIVVGTPADRNGTGVRPTDDATTPVAGDQDGRDAAATRETDFRVVADSRTNSLVLTGTRPVLDRLSALIAELDVAQPQVNVQVRIQEITRRSALALGIDWSAGLGNFTASVLGGGLSFIFDTTQVISSLNILAVLDALETQGLTRRVDDSNLTVLNNGEASIQSGGQIFITLAGSPPIERTIPYGVQIDVTPRITADGRITLQVVAKVEDVLSTTEDPSFLNLSTRNMNTTVTVQEGQTLLLGGLLQNSLAVTRQRLPILGALPLIGDVFGRTVTEEDDVDLLLIVTANIIE